MLQNGSSEDAGSFAKSISGQKQANGSDEQKLASRDEINLKSRAKRRSRRGR